MLCLEWVDSVVYAGGALLISVAVGMAECSTERRRGGKTSNLDGSGHKGLADFRESILASLPIFNHCGMVVSLC